MTSDCPTRAPAERISARDAAWMIGAAVRRARDLARPVCVVVADAAGEIIDQQRMPGAWREADEIALTKAFIACSFALETRRLVQDLHPSRDPGDDSLSPHQAIFAGGIPLQSYGTVIGAVGVSGGAAGDDQACAEAAIAAVGPRSRRPGGRA